MNGQRHLWFWLALAGGALAFVYLLSEILLPFVAGMAAAYLLDPLADRLERAGASRTLAVTAIIFGFFGLVGSVLLLMAPPLAGQAAELGSRLPALAETLREWAEPALEKFQSGLTPEQASKLEGSLGEYAGIIIKTLGDLLGNLAGNALAFLSILSLVVISPIVSFYLLRDWDRIVEWIDGSLPRDHADAIREQARAIDATLSSFLRGQGTVCLALGVFYSVGLTLVGLDLGLLVGVIAGLISFIPYLGAGVGLVVGLGLALYQFSLAGWPQIGAVAAVFLIGQALESYVLQPKLLGEAVGLHPVWLMFSLLAAGALFGFTGVLLAVPAAAVIGVLVRFGLRRYRQSVYYLGRNPK